VPAHWRKLIVQSQWAEGGRCRSTWVQTEELIQLAEITVIVGSVGLFVASFAASYTMWHRRAATAFERVPVTARSAPVVRRDSVQRGNAS
jgi:hypothetical protein